MNLFDFYLRHEASGRIFRARVRAEMPYNGLQAVYSYMMWEGRSPDSFTFLGWKHAIEEVEEILQAAVPANLNDISGMDIERGNPT